MGFNWGRPCFPRGHTKPMSQQSFLDAHCIHGAIYLFIKGELVGTSHPDSLGLQRATS